MKTLITDNEGCLQYLRKHRWPEGVTWPIMCGCGDADLPREIVGTPGPGSDRQLFLLFNAREGITVPVLMILVLPEAGRGLVAVD